MSPVIIEPTEEHLVEVLGWLKVEEDTTGNGFYCNLSVISKCFSDGRARCLVEHGKVIAFGLYRLECDYSEIVIMEVHPKHRSRGLGVHLSKHLLALLQSLGAKSVHVQCSPVTSEPFWRKQGFIESITEQEGRSPYAPPELQRSLV